MGAARWLRASFQFLVSAGFLLISTALAFAANNPERWYNARQIHYTITGIFDGRSIVDISGDAHFTDRVEIEFVTTADGVLVGEVSIRNFPSEISDIKASEPGCNPPELQGPMEFYTVKAFECMACNAEMAPYAEPDPDGNIPAQMAPSSVILWERQFPAMVVNQVCKDKLNKAARTENSGDMFYVPGIGDFLMNPSQVKPEKVQVNPEAGVLVNKDGGWTWTYEGVPITSAAK